MESESGVTKGMIKKIQSDKKLWEYYTRCEEYNPAHLDSHRRFTGKNSKEKDIFTHKVSK